MRAVSRDKLRDPEVKAMSRALPLVLAVFAAAAPGGAAEAPADLLLTGAAVYTVDAARSWAEAVAVRDGRIAYVGTDAGAKDLVGPKTRILRLDGRMLLPAFQDAHVHPVSGGVELGQCNLNDLATADLILAKVRACAADSAGRPWLVGGGWSMTAFPAGAPNRQALDAIVPDRPALLSAADGHSAWVNSKALGLAGITAATPDPEDGRIERDASGVPTGTLRESAADLVSRLAPKTTAAERLAGLRRALAQFNRQGITALQEASAGTGAEGSGASDTLDAYLEAERQGWLTARVVAALGTDPARGPEQVDELVALRKRYAARRLKPVAAKIFADGVIESRTAAMLEPYLDRPGDRGQPIFDPVALNALVARLDAADFNVHVHAIGDRAVRLTLDAFEGARGKAPGPRTRRHQIAHLELIAAEDVPRFRALGITANFQPLWAYADSYIRDLTWPALSPERSRRLYPIGDLARSGAVLAFGSDWSVSSSNPLEGIQVAVTRQSIDPADRREPMLPEQAIGLPEAIAAYTIGAAHANGLDAETGSIEVGKAADLIVLSDDLFRRRPVELAGARVLLTLLDGEPVYRDPSVAW
jgi:hypothetical protein